MKYIWIAIAHHSSGWHIVGAFDYEQTARNACEKDAQDIRLSDWHHHWNGADDTFWQADGDDDWSYYVVATRLQPEAAD